MAKFSYLFYSAPRADAILVNRFIILALSIAALAVFATTLHVYKTNSGPTGSLGPFNHNVIVTNALPIVPLTMSIAWSITQLTLLTRRMVRAYRQNNCGLATVGERNEGWDRPKVLVHPGWDLGVDFVCGVFLVVVTVLTGEEAAKWRSGRLDDGSGGTMQVDVNACPTFDPATGVLDYWCGQTWNNLVDLTFDGQNIMGPTAGLIFTRCICACYDLYQLRRPAHAEELQSKDPEDGIAAPPPPYQAQEIELGRVE